MFFEISQEELDRLTEIAQNLKVGVLPPDQTRLGEEILNIVSKILEFPPSAS